MKLKERFEELLEKIGFSIETEKFIISSLLGFITEVLTPDVPKSIPKNKLIN